MLLLICFSSCFRFRNVCSGLNPSLRWLAAICVCLSGRFPVQPFLVWLSS
jgi:hypothetical protein